MEEKLYKILGDLGIEFEKFEHEPVFTCEESKSFYERNNLDGARAKSLFLRNRKGKKHFLALVEEHHRVDLKALTKFLEEGQQVSFASPERLKKYLGLIPGAVTPLALIHPEAKDILVVVDNGLLKHEFVHFHPLRNSATLRFTSKDLLKFLESRGNEIMFYDF